MVSFFTKLKYLRKSIIFSGICAFKGDTENVKDKFLIRHGFQYFIVLYKCNNYVLAEVSDIYGESGMYIPYSSLDIFFKYWEFSS